MTQNLALCFSVSRICCYNIYKMACCVKEPPPKEEFDLICVGLDKSGKTALLNSFLQDSLDTSPTTGFNIKDIHLDSVNLHVKELGGSHQIRPYWARYYGPDIHGVMFVVDASETDDSRWNLARQELRSVLDSDKLVDAPVFVLATHQDCAGACGEVELMERLQFSAGQSESRNGEIFVLLCNVKQRDTVMLALTKIANLLLVAHGDDVIRNDQADAD
uniref:ADP-ribosylation factor-like protein 3 n=2 Tax=Macrostomum lignano TaxID=282301 RepID=A0A1I8I326_9PLAT